MKKIKLAALLLMTAALGCSSTPNIPQALCPVSPSLPTINAEELQGVSDDTYRKLVERELRLKEYIRLLEVNCG